MSERPPSRCQLDACLRPRWRTHGEGVRPEATEVGEPRSLLLELVLERRSHGLTQRRAGRRSACEPSDRATGDVGAGGSVKCREGRRRGRREPEERRTRTMKEGGARGERRSEGEKSESPPRPARGQRAGERERTSQPARRRRLPTRLQPPVQRSRARSPCSITSPSHTRVSRTPGVFPARADALAPQAALSSGPSRTHPPPRRSWPTR